MRSVTAEEAPMPIGKDRLSISVRGLREDELDEADRIVRLAFGTFLGLANPLDFMGDADYVRTRWTADPDLALAAVVDGRLVGTNFVTGWGSVGFFGPLTVEPSLWNQGVARALLDETMPIFERLGAERLGLFTFAQSPKHVSLYQDYGFLPRFLTAILRKAVVGSAASWTTFSELADRGAGLVAAASVTGSVLEGLDVRREIEATLAQNLGDTVLVEDGGEVVALAVCHVGPGTEAGSDTCYVKFAAARSGGAAEGRFARLLDACEGFAASRGVSTIVAGVSTGRRAAYRAMLDRGYRPATIGIAMHRPDDDAYHRPTAYVLDDWR
jgi:GNAT superfamily N-acetyltransferase